MLILAAVSLVSLSKKNAFFFFFLVLRLKAGKSTKLIYLLPSLNES